MFLLKDGIAGESEKFGAENRFGAVFAHRDRNRNIVGYFRAGDGFNKDGDHNGRGVFQEGSQSSPTRIYLARNTLEAMSMAQHDDLDVDSAVVAPDGDLTNDTRLIIVHLAQKFGESAKWNASAIDDPNFKRDVEAAIRKGCPLAKIAKRDPNEGIEPTAAHRYNSWSDLVRGPSFSMASKAKAEMQAASQEAKRNAAEAIQRQVQEAKVNRKGDNPYAVLDDMNGDFPASPARGECPKVNMPNEAANMAADKAERDDANKQATESPKAASPFPPTQPEPPTADERAEKALTLMGAIAKFGEAKAKPAAANEWGFSGLGLEVAKLGVESAEVKWKECLTPAERHVFDHYTLSAGAMRPGQHPEAHLAEAKVWAMERGHEELVNIQPSPGMSH